MQNIKNKKALSDVVSAVLMIMLAIVAVGILGAAINKFLLSPQLSPQFSCIDMQTIKHLSTESACYNATSKEVKATLKRNLEERFPITSLTFVIDGENTNSASWTCGPNCLDCQILDIGNRKNYFFSVPDIPNPTKLHLLADSCDLGIKDIQPC